jgi:hypothetical protein
MPSSGSADSGKAGNKGRIMGVIRKWNKGRVAMLGRLLARGMNSTQVAQALDESRSSVISACKRFGYTLGTTRRRIRWTQEMDDRLIALAAKGLTAAKIGEEMGESREAVKSRARHLPDVDLGAHGRHDHRQNGSPKTARRITEIERQQALIVMRDIDTTGIEMLQARQCRFPVSDKPFRFCTRRQEHGSYCRDHYIITHVNAPPERVS